MWIRTFVYYTQLIPKICNGLFIFVVKKCTASTFSKSCKPILNWILGSTWVFSFAPNTLSHLSEDDAQWQVCSVAAQHASRLLTLWGCLRPPGRDSVTMRARSNTEPWVMTKRPPAHNKGTVVFSSLLPEDSLFNGAVRALWFICFYDRNFSFLCNSCGVWMKMFSWSFTLNNPVYKHENFYSSRFVHCMTVRIWPQKHSAQDKIHESDCRD